MAGLVATVDHALRLYAMRVDFNEIFSGSGGSGIPQAIAARHLNDPKDRTLLLSMKIAFGKIFLTIVGLFSGASIGREGPTVQIGASIMLLSARIGSLEHARGLILAGSAAGIAAAFNTPLADRLCH